MIFSFLFVSCLLKKLSSSTGPAPPPGVSVDVPETVKVDAPSACTEQDVGLWQGMADKLFVELLVKSTSLYSFVYYPTSDENFKTKQLGTLTGLSAPCSNCFSIFSTCALSKCRWPCSLYPTFSDRMQSYGCGECLRTSGCTPQLELCTGVSERELPKGQHWLVEGTDEAGLFNGQCFDWPRPEGYEKAIPWMVDPWAFSMAILECSSAAWGKGSSVPPCLAKKYPDFTNLPCLDCFGANVSCGTYNCAMYCMPPNNSPTSRACLDCVNRNCLRKLYACVGAVGPAEMPTPPDGGTLPLRGLPSGLQEKYGGSVIAGPPAVALAKKSPLVAAPPPPPAPDGAPFSPPLSSGCYRLPDDSNRDTLDLYVAVDPPDPSTGLGGVDMFLKFNLDVFKSTSPDGYTREFSCLQGPWTIDTGGKPFLMINTPLNPCFNDLVSWFNARLEKQFRGSEGYDKRPQIPDLFPLGYSPALNEVTVNIITSLKLRFFDQAHECSKGLPLNVFKTRGSTYDVRGE